MRLKKWGVCLLIFGVVAFGGLAQAQQRPLANYQNRGAQYVIGNQDQLLIRVNIWGFVKMPGQYLVPTNTDLVSLISYAGGPLEDAQMKKVKLIRTALGDSTEKVMLINIKKFLELGDIRQNPQLFPNDTIVISPTRYHWVIKSMDFISKLGSIAYFSYFALRLIHGK